MNLQALRDSVNRKDYQVCEPLTPDEKEALKSSIAQHGITVPVAVDEDYRIIDGYHRMEIFFALADEGFDVSVPELQVLEGMSDREKWEEAYRRNYLRRQMTAAQKQAKAVALCREGLSNEQIAATIGVSIRSAHEYTVAVREEIKRQRDERIRQLASEGKSQREIARELGIHKNTVRNVLGGQKSQGCDFCPEGEGAADSDAEPTQSEAESTASPGEHGDVDADESEQDDDEIPDDETDASDPYITIAPVFWEDVKDIHGHKYDGEFNEEAHASSVWANCFDCLHGTDVMLHDDFFSRTCDKFGVHLEDWEQYSNYPPCYSLETDTLTDFAPQAEEEQPEASTQNVHFSSETPEHYTPAHVLEAVAKLMGAIDLDPCSNSKTDPNVPAQVHYTKEDDGLQQKWAGRTYLNPPYGRGIQDWVGKLVTSFESGDVSEAIALVPARTDTQWWQLLRNYPCCFVTGRLTFIGNDDPAPFPSAIYYLGERHDDFFREFSAFGDIWIRLDDQWFTE